MKKLISMTDFVLETIKKPLGGQQVASVRHHEIEKYRAIMRYANFLKQPLEIWQFVPCKLVDGVWEVLEEKSIFNTTDEDYIFNSEAFDEYQQAKERCLFEGFEVIKRTTYYVVTYNNVTVWFSWDDSKTIEDLVSCNLTLK